MKFKALFQNYLNNKHVRIRIQVTVFVLALTALLVAGVSSTLDHMHQRGIQGGFNFLMDPAGFDISETLIPFDSSNSYLLAFCVGLLNTLKVSALSILACTVFGTLLGLGRTLPNPLVRGMCRGYTELFRNVPLLLQLLIWYVILVEYLPDSAQPLNSYLGVLQLSLSKEGLTLQIPNLWDLILSQSAPTQLATERTQLLSIKRLDLSPEFIALFVGLSLYTSAFAGEVVRAGLQSVTRDQIQAGQSLGLSPGQVTRFITAPQALRVIIGPMTNQYLNLIKNSSLAVAIGYPDLVSISNTTLNQTGHALECVLIIMAVYFAVSLTTAYLMSRYNARILYRG